ncbi:unnamed protein product [Boreogadus saida]
MCEVLDVGIAWVAEVVDEDAAYVFLLRGKGVNSQEKDCGKQNAQFGWFGVMFVDHDCAYVNGDCLGVLRSTQTSVAGLVTTRAATVAESEA